MAVYGYIRVSSADQNEERQLIALCQAGIPENAIFIDKQSGKNFNRPQYQKMLRTLRSGDVLTVLSLDRLGRNYRELLKEWQKLTSDMGVRVRVLDMPILNTEEEPDLIHRFLSDLILQLLSFVAENERDNIRKRQAEGIAAARAKGVHLGRPSKPLPDNYETIVSDWHRKKITARKACALCGVSLSTFYRITGKNR